MRAFIAIVLLALFAVAMAADRSQWINKWVKKAQEIKPDVKDAVKSGRDFIKSAKNIRDKIRANSDAEFFKKLGKVFKKIAPIVKKGIQIYGKVKGMGILSDDKLVKKVQKKVQEKLPKAKKAFGQAKKAFGQGKKIFTAVKKLRAESQSDAEFFSKIKKWWDTKGKNLYEKAKTAVSKGKEWYAKGKQIYDILKPAKKTEESEADFAWAALAGSLAKKLIQKKLNKKNKKQNVEQSDAEFFNKIKKWWDTKGKNLYEKAKNAVAKGKEWYAKGKQIYDILKPAKKASEEAAPEADTDATSDCGMAYQSGSPLGNKQCVSVQGKPVVVETAVAFEKMNAAAAAAGIKLQVNSGFRTQKEQEYLYNCYKTKKCNNGNLAARPGYSNHQNGRAMDISCSNPKVFDWMRNNASKFGFIRTVASENWHWELLPGKKCNASVSYTCK